MSSNLALLNARVGACLLELRLAPASRRGGGWSVELPSAQRGSIGVALRSRQRTVRMASFVMRAPDRNHLHVYRRLLERNLEMAYWRFGVDAHGDIFIAAHVDADRLSVTVLDAMFGLLVTYIDESYESTVRLGFDIPDGVSIVAPPGGVPPEAPDAAPAA